MKRGVSVHCYGFSKNSELKLRAKSAMRKFGVCLYAGVTLRLAEEVLLSTSDWSREIMTCATPPNLNQLKVDELFLFRRKRHSS